MRSGEIDLLLASPECTHHSLAKGSRRPSEKSRQTSNYVVNFARRLKPRWIVLENVVQLLDWRGYTLNSLTVLGLLVASAVIVDDELRTTAPHVWAAGDVIGSNTENQMATPVGAHDGG